MRKYDRDILLWLFGLDLGIAFGAGLYESRIVVRQWEATPPQTWPNTGHQFWVFVTTVPLTLLTLASMVAAWQDQGPRRYWWLGAVAIAVAERSATFSYFIPGGVLFGVVGSLRTLVRRPALTGKEGMIGEVGTVRSPVGVDTEGWVFVHGELWRAVLAFAPVEPDLRDGEPIAGAGRRVRVLGLGEGGVMQVVPIGPPGSGRDLD